MGKETAGQIRGRIGFFPSNIVQNMVADGLHQVAD